MIRLNHIYFRRDERTILNDVNLDMRQGEHWVILGRNGSGKSTILEMLTGYLFPSSGTVEVLGHTYGTVDVREVRKRIGYISQALMDKLTLRDPVWEVIATGEYGYLRFYQEIPKEVIEKADAMLEEVRLSHLRNQPLGTLSQGERKKIMLARALMRDPELLIMDEPCSGLDLYEREKLLESINGLSKRNLLIIYVTHHIEEIMPLFTHIALIESGKIVAAGPKDEVLAADNLLRTFDVPVSLDWSQGRPWIRVLSS
jgi:iron complex transport system ATP-binding protein